MKIWVFSIILLLVYGCHNDISPNIFEYLKDEINILKYKIAKPKRTDKPLLISYLNTDAYSSHHVDIQLLISKIKNKLPIKIKVAEKILLDSTTNFRLVNGLKQWDIEDIFKKNLIQKTDKSIFGILVLTEADIYPSEGWKYVFGKADSEKQLAIVSTFRLKNDISLFEKTFMHEVGHLLKLAHCEGYKCVMKESHKIEDIENISADFCKNCTKKLKLLKKPL